MTHGFSLFNQRLCGKRATSRTFTCLWFLCNLLVWTTTACTHVATLSRPPDLAAEQIISRIKQTNADLVQFKCVGKITVSNPGQPVQSYRSAIAGKLSDQLRIDMFAPFGGASSTIASDGEHLFLVLHATRDYYKKGFGDGSLRRFIKIDITVGDLLELLVGRIPLDTDLSPQTTPADDADRIAVQLVDRWGKIRQRIELDAAGRPLMAQWFDGHARPEFSLRVSGQQVLDGFALPIRIDLLAASGNKISVILERYETNTVLEDTLFAPPPISS